MSYASLIAPLTLALLAAPGVVVAIEPLDTFSARLGGYVTDFDTEVRADGATQAGTSIDLERDLGLDSGNVIGLVGLTWRPWERHDFGFTYYKNDADRSRMLQRDIVFQGTTYQASSTVRARSNVDAFEAYYVWWAVSHERWALGPRLGLVWYKVDVGVSLELDVNGNPASGSIGDEASLDVPAPTIGGSWRWTPGDDWRVSAEAGYFSADINDIDADVTFGRIGLEWFPWESAGFSLDYTANKINTDVSKTNFNGNLDFVDSGFRLGLVYRF